MTSEETQRETEKSETIQNRLRGVLTHPRVLKEYRPTEGTPEVAKFKVAAEDFSAKLTELSTAYREASKRSAIFVGVMILLAVITFASDIPQILWPNAGPIDSFLNYLILIGLFVLLCVVGPGLIYYAPVKHGEEQTFFVLSEGFEDVSVGVSSHAAGALRSAYEVLRTLGQINQAETSIGTALGYPDGVPDDKAVHLAELQVQPDQPGDHIISRLKVDLSEPESLAIQLEQIIDLVYHDEYPSAVQVTVAPQIDISRLLSRYKHHINTLGGTGVVSLLRQGLSGKDPDKMDDEGRKEIIDEMSSNPTFGITIRALVVTPKGVEASDLALLNEIGDSVETTENRISATMTRRTIQLGADTDIQQTDTVTNKLLKRFHYATLKNKSAATNIIQRKPAYITVQGADVWRYALISTVTKPQLATQLNAIRRDQTIPSSPSNPYYEKMQGELPFEAPHERADTDLTDSESDPDEPGEDDTDNSESNEGES